MEGIKYYSNYTHRTGIWSYPFFGLVYIIVIIPIIWNPVLKEPELLLNIRIYLPLLILYFFSGTKLYSYNIQNSIISIKYHLLGFTKKIPRENIEYIFFDDTKLKFRSRNKGIVMHIGIVQKTGKIIYLNNNSEIGLLLKVLKEEDYKLKLNLTKTPIPIDIPDHIH